MSQSVYVPFSGRSNPKAVLPAVTHAMPRQSCHGSPEGVISASPGTTCTDLDTGDTWVKFEGTQEFGWRLNGTVGDQGVKVLG